MPIPSLEISPADAAKLKEIIRIGSRSFYAASQVLPKEIRLSAFALYAFCRDCDDIVDERGGGPVEIADLEARLNAAYLGAPRDTPVDRAFSAIVRRHRVPRAFPAALIEGLTWDADGRRYETLSELNAYAARVAGTVGAMMAVVMGAQSAHAAARACDLGVAMQLTNIARDIGEDARAGRLYAPLEWLRSEGLDPDAFLAQPVFDRRIAAVTRRLLETAAPLYLRGLSGVTLLPAGCRTAIVAAGAIYRDIGREIRLNGYDSVSRRAVVSKLRKINLLARSALASRPAVDETPPLRETRFLVDALGPWNSGRSPAEPAPASGVAVMLDLFIRLERRERALASRAVR